MKQSLPAHVHNLWISKQFEVMCKGLWIFSVSFLLALPLFGQVKMDEDFELLLEEAGIAFLSPVEARYKRIPVWKNPLQSYDYAIRSRREGLEIRYIIKPYEAGNPLSALPQVEAIRLLTHLATNDQEELIVGHEIAQEVLAEAFHADWGRQYFFKPKSSFSRWQHCELLALHKAGQGTAFVLFLFDEPSRELGNRFYALQFTEEGKEDF